VTEALQLTSYQEAVNSIVETRILQCQECNTGPKAQDTTTTQGLLMQAHRNYTSSQDARTQGAPEDMFKCPPPGQPLVHIILSKEATELSQDSGYSPALESMVKFGQMIHPSHALVSRVSTQYFRTQDAPEAMLKIEVRTSLSEPLWNILQTKAAKIGEQENTITKNRDTNIQQEGWTKEKECYMSALQLSEYEVNNIIMPPLLEPSQRPSTPVQVSEPMDEPPQNAQDRECHSTPG
jgi:hypothetical protein